MIPTSNLDGVAELGGLVGGDLAGVVAGVGLLCEGDDQVVAVLLGLDPDPAALVDDLVGHGDDFLSTLPQKNKAL